MICLLISHDLFQKKNVESHVRTNHASFYGANGNIPDASRALGATRGADSDARKEIFAWRSPSDTEVEALCQMRLQAGISTGDMQDTSLRCLPGSMLSPPKVNAVLHPFWRVKHCIHVTSLCPVFLVFLHHLEASSSFLL